jgi:hypothetical protein
MGLDSAYVRGNDAIALAAERAGSAERLVDFICECADDECLDRIPLTLWQYREIRNGRANGVVATGHAPRR